MIRVYCDFDGTLVPQDIGNAFFREYAGTRAEEIVVGYLEGTMNARDCLAQECAAIPRMDRETLDAFADRYAVDPAIPGFIEWCAGNGWTFKVLSDGLDAYVGRVLHRAGLDHIPFAANAAEFVEEQGVPRLSVSFPYRDELCATCGNCKRRHIAAETDDRDVVVYIGDGISDRCAARVADVVFATRSLIRFCQSENITYHPFKSIADVHARLKDLQRLGRITQRREATVARQALFMQG